jgi:hypothetical protein
VKFQDGGSQISGWIALLTTVANAGANKHCTVFVEGIFKV